VFSLFFSRSHNIRSIAHDYNGDLLHAGRRSLWNDTISSHKVSVQFFSRPQSLCSSSRQPRSVGRLNYTLSTESGKFKGNPAEVGALFTTVLI